ncbi:hypothetical protein Plhal304r1_c014g0051771 [Plasmopara halstedii]
MLRMVATSLDVVDRTGFYVFGKYDFYEQHWGMEFHPVETNPLGKTPKIATCSACPVG